MRARVKQVRSLHVGEKAVLLGAFHAVDTQRTGKVKPEQFVRAWERLQVTVTTEEAMAVGTPEWQNGGNARFRFILASFDAYTALALASAHFLAPFTPSKPRGYT